MRRHHLCRTRRPPHQPRQRVQLLQLERHWLRRHLHNHHKGIRLRPVLQRHHLKRRAHPPLHGCLGRLDTSFPRRCGVAIVISGLAFFFLVVMTNHVIKSGFWAFLFWVKWADFFHLFFFIILPRYLDRLQTLSSFTTRIYSIT